MLRPPWVRVLKERVSEIDVDRWIVERQQNSRDGVNLRNRSPDAVYYYVPCTITGALLGKTLRGAVTPILGRFSGAPASGVLLVGQISGLNPINLNPTNRHATNVNFDMDAVAGPR